MTLHHALSTSSSYLFNTTWRETMFYLLISRWTSVWTISEMKMRNCQSNGIPIRRKSKNENKSNITHAHTNIKALVSRRAVWKFLEWWSCKARRDWTKWFRSATTPQNAERYPPEKHSSSQWFMRSYGKVSIFLKIPEKFLIELVCHWVPVNRCISGPAEARHCARRNSNVQSNISVDIVTSKTWNKNIGNSTT